MSTETNFTIGFIGLGLIGGSIAKNVRRVFPNYTVIGYDTDKEALKKAVEEGVLDRPAAELNRDFSECSYIFLCAPVQHNLQFLEQLKPNLKEGCRQRKRRDS